MKGISIKFIRNHREILFKLAQCWVYMEETVTPTRDEIQKNGPQVNEEVRIVRCAEAMARDINEAFDILAAYSQTTYYLVPGQSLDDSILGRWHRRAKNSRGDRGKFFWALHDEKKLLKIIRSLANQTKDVEYYSGRLPYPGRHHLAPRKAALLWMLECEDFRLTQGRPWLLEPQTEGCQVRKGGRTETSVTIDDSGTRVTSNGQTIHATKKKKIDEISYYAGGGRITVNTGSGWIDMGKDNGWPFIEVGEMKVRNGGKISIKNTVGGVERTVG